MQKEVLFINSKATVVTGRVVPESNGCNGKRERESQHYSRESLKQRNRESKSSIVSE